MKSEKLKVLMLVIIFSVITSEGRANGSFTLNGWSPVSQTPGVDSLANAWGLFLGSPNGVAEEFQAKFPVDTSYVIWEKNFTPKTTPDSLFLWLRTVSGSVQMEIRLTQIAHPESLATINDLVDSGSWILKKYVVPSTGVAPVKYNRWRVVMKPQTNGSGLRRLALDSWVDAYGVEVPDSAITRDKFGDPAVTTAKTFEGAIFLPGDVNRPALAIDVSVDSLNSKLFSIRFDRTPGSTATDADVPAVKAFNDLDGDHMLDGGEPQLGVAAFGGGQANLAMNFNVGTAVQHVLFAVDVAPGANPNTTFGLRINSAGDVQAESYVRDQGFPIQGNPNPLAVELVSFQAQAVGHRVRLTWATAVETNNYGWFIEANQNSRDWETAGFVKGSGTSVAIRQYEFIDQQFRGQYYRLKQVDTDGATSYSAVVEVGKVPRIFELKQNYPNPFNSTTLFSYSLDRRCEVSLEVIDTLGHLVAIIVDGETQEAGWHSVCFTPTGLASGTYFYSLKTENFTVTNRMVLVK